MKILIMGSRSYPPGIGGIERYVYEFSEVASRMGHEITIIAQGEPAYSKYGNIEVIRCTTTDKKPLDRFHMILNTLLKNDRTYDIYWGHGAPGMCLYGLKPYVFTIHGLGYLRQDDRHPLLNDLMRWWYSWMLKKPAANIAVDRQSYEIAKDINPETYLIHNGINVERFVRDCASPFEPGSKNVLFLGRLIQSKGILDIMEGFSDCDDAVLHIIGTGPLEDEVKRRADASGGRIVYHGKVDEVECYFKHADVYVLPSYFEGFPTTVLEAMASGTPTVISDISAFKDTFVDREETLYLKPGDVRAIMESIEELIQDEELAKVISEKAFARVNKEYSWEAQTRKILGVFERLVSKNEGR